MGNGGYKTAQETKDAAAAETEAVRMILVHHESIQPNAVLNKAGLIKFYKDHKEAIDELIGPPVPKQIADFISRFYLHRDLLQLLGL